jgi:hypothetical protein
MPANSEDKFKPGQAPDALGEDQKAEARHDEQAHAPDKNLQHGGDFSRGSVERNRNQGGYDGKR